MEGLLNDSQLVYVIQIMYCPGFFVQAIRLVYSFILALGFHGTSNFYWLNQLFVLFSYLIVVTEFQLF
jgi:hypothetical protein